MPTSFKKDEGWAKFGYTIHPRKFNRKVTLAIRKANKLNAQLVLRQVRQDIKSGSSFARNAVLTMKIKKSRKPLVDTGHRLFQALTSVEVDVNSVFVGVLMRDGFYDIATALHEGVTIKVTDKMRRMFSLLTKASEGKVSPTVLTGSAADLWERMPGNWKPLSASTDRIVIPSRPFMRTAFSNANLKAKINKNWADALAWALSTGGG